MKITSSIIGMEANHQSLSVQQSSLIVGLRMKRSEWEDEQNGINHSTTSDHSAQTDSKNNDSENDSAQSKPVVALSLSKDGIDQAKSLSIQTPEKLRNQEEEMPDKTMSTLKALIAFLKGIAKDPKAYEHLEKFIEGQEQAAKSAYSSSSSVSASFQIAGIASHSASIGANNGRNDTVIVSRRETFSAENEYTTFSAAGLARTEDGRELSFNIDYAMSREFMEYTHTDERYIPPKNVCDPLVINVGAETTSLSDQKFTFDLDADGKEDSISMLKKGSGFLALDKNEDGKINDGTELFGTKSGNGFADLAEYDEDGNGWIDENDSIFDKLRVWYKNDDGTDQLVSLRSADVGAIHLGNVSSQFSLKGEEDPHDLNGYIRSTGVFLHESVGAGTIQHVDFAL